MFMFNTISSIRLNPYVMALLLLHFRLLHRVLALSLSYFLGLMMAQKTNMCLSQR
ncbi:Unknown protein sequence [Pseudomonas syringae pv. philadelphi]|nr:Unknown protein sequence [Pseudomonas syringae pv. berberidis]KPY26121.1 Unknown protein sequence [Pseudomonas syringae pv. philadelphi]RMM29364.1 hypothetical protein ALQ83_04089 [Pseudomonas syringae pv. berberidis]RMP59238.1 hypothetical protein ALQ19_01635 [Pseudomonas syringae pv. berberidis]RMQ41524.1 hypothetical protein ALQ06_01209 [Pseudomonas syringae pv. berberidis]